MLKSLRSIESGKRAAILARSIRDLTESPFQAEFAGQKEWSDVVLEAAQTAGISHRHASKADLSRLRQILANELRKLVLPTSSIAKVRARVGQKGLFKPSEYTVSFSREFRENKDEFHVSEQDVSWVVEAPDRFDHLKIDGTNEFSLTLVARRKATPSPHWLLAIFRRNGDKLQCVTAWKIPCSVVSYAPAMEAIELLRAFVEVYGAKFRVGDEEGRLFVYENMQQSANVEISKTENVNLCFFARPLRGGVVEVALAYAIKADQYIESLQDEGLI